MVKYCKMCGEEINSKEFVDRKTGRPMPNIKKKILVNLGYCYGCLIKYKETKRIESAVNNPKKRKKYVAELQQKVDKGIISQDEMTAGLKKVDELFLKNNKEQE